MFKVLLLGWRPETISGAQEENLTRFAGSSCKSKIFLFYTFSDAKTRWKRNTRHYCFQNMYKSIPRQINIISNKKASRMKLRPWERFLPPFFKTYMYKCGLVGEGVVKLSPGPCSNPTKRSSELRNPILIRGSRWPWGQVWHSLDNGPNLAMGQLNSR